MNKEEFYTIFRNTFDGTEQAYVAKIVKEYQCLSDNDRIDYWAYLMKDGANELEFAKFVHKYLGALLMEASGRLPQPTRTPRRK